jgi:hypothetical protein
VWRKFWGYIDENRIAPILISEFGTGNGASDIESVTPGSQGQWFASLVNFLQNRSSLNWTYWALNGEDNYALLDNQYHSTPLSSLKQGELASIQFALAGENSGGGGLCSAAPSAPAGLVASAVSRNQINLSWNAATPPSNCSVRYSVFRGASSGFVPSSSNQIATGLAATSFSDFGLAAATTYYYKVEAVDAAGVSSSLIQASATTQSPAVGGVACHIDYSNINQWNTGFQVTITIHNWALRFNFPNNQQITALWNGGYTQSGATVTIKNLNYNGSIAAGGSYDGVGFTANYSGANAAPTSFSVRGPEASCQPKTGRDGLPLVSPRSASLGIMGMQEVRNVLCKQEITILFCRPVHSLIPKRAGGD